MPRQTGKKTVTAVADTLVVQWPGGSGKAALHVGPGMTGPAIQLEIAPDGVNYVALQGKKATDGTAATSLAAQDVLTADVTAGPEALVRARCSALTSGTGVVRLDTSV